MANISSLLKTIKNAIYGRDMRQALHDAIKMTNDDVETKEKITKVSSEQPPEWSELEWWYRIVRARSVENISEPVTKEI